VDNAIQKEKNDRLLIKSTISLCVLLAMYHLVLEREKYIPSIGSTSYPVILSFTIPFITIDSSENHFSAAKTRLH
jgi:hypothetical protein